MVDGAPLLTDNDKEKRPPLKSYSESVCYRFAGKNSKPLEIKGQEALAPLFHSIPKLEIHIQFEIFKNFAGRIIVALRLAKNCLALS